MVDCLVSLSDAVIGHARAVTCLRETPTSVSVTLSCSLVPLTCVTPPLVTDTENQFTLHVTRGGGMVVVGWVCGGVAPIRTRWPPEEGATLRGRGFLPEGGEPWVRLVDGWTDTNYRGVGRGGEGRDAPHCSPFVQTCRLHSIVSNS